MDFSCPPTCWEEHMLWKAFVGCAEADVWQVVQRWVKRYGNPFYIPDEETEEEQSERRWFQEAILACHKKN